MLARALADVSEGFYVDVGAQDPTIDSVTRMFYEQGWKGINIEPVPHWFKRLKAERSRDINLMCAVSAKTGSIDLYEVSDSGLTTANEEYAREHAAAGWRVEKHAVPTRKLDDIFEEHAPEVVHFLKIDVEGMEHEVLKGLSLRRHRPWILVIEATRPNAAVDVSSVWEAMVLEAKYSLAYRDGLNRFYLAEEQLSRLAAFEAPPNVFDNFIPYREQASNDYAHGLEERLQVLHDTAGKYRSELQEATAKAEVYRTNLLAVTETANAQQDRLKVLGASLRERQALLEQTAARAESYRADLLVVTETANARQDRLNALEASLQERQSLLEEVAVRAEGYRTDLLLISDTASNMQQRIGELEESLSMQEAAHEESMSLMRRDLHEVSIAAENRRVLIASLEARYGQREGELRQLRQEVNDVYASRSWRFTAPLRNLSRRTRRAIERILRAAAAIHSLRKIVGWMLRGGLRKRVLRLAGFVEQQAAEAAALQALGETVATSSEAVTLSSAGMRVYRLLAMASKHAARDRQ